MTLIALDIPDDPAELPGWLERRIVGLDLGDFVCQWEAMIGRTEEPRPTLEEVCGAELATVCERGLGALDETRLRRLLRHPRLLLPLQEKILIDGGAYWDHVPLAEEHRALVAQQAERLQPRLRATMELAADHPIEAAEFAAANHRRPASMAAAPRPSWLSAGAYAAIAVAIVLGLTLAFSQFAGREAPPAGSPPAWGFSKSGLLTANISAREYLGSLAMAAGEWSNKRPADAAALTKRLATFRAGCEELLAAEHPQLGTADRKWLLAECRAVVAEIDRFVAELQASPDRFADVQSAADARIGAFREELKRRAEAAA